MPFAGVPARSTAILRSRQAARLLWTSHARGRAVYSSASGAMDPDVLAAVQAIHAGPTKAVFAVTGGGAQARCTCVRGDACASQLNACRLRVCNCLAVVTRASRGCYPYLARRGRCSKPWCLTLDLHWRTFWAASR